MPTSILLSSQKEQEYVKFTSFYELVDVLLLVSSINALFLYISPVRGSVYL